MEQAKGEKEEFERIIAVQKQQARTHTNTTRHTSVHSHSHTDKTEQTKSDRQKETPQERAALWWSALHCRRRPSAAALRRSGGCVWPTRRTSGGRSPPRRKRIYKTDGQTEEGSTCQGRAGSRETSSCLSVCVCVASNFLEEGNLVRAQLAKQRKKLERIKVSQPASPPHVQGMECLLGTHHEPHACVVCVCVCVCVCASISTRRGRSKT